MKQKRRRDSQLKVSKHVHLTPEGEAQIKQFAKENDTSFSAAIEMLALTGMEVDTVQSILPFILESVHRSVRSAFNRMAKLSSAAAIEAGASREIASVTLLQQLNLLRRLYPDEYEGMMQIGREEPDDLMIRAARDRINVTARSQSVRRLKKPLIDIDDILSEMPSQGQSDE